MKTGDHLRAIVADWLGLSHWAGCTCEKLRKAMNNHGPRWSRRPKNFYRIVRIMRKTAKKAPDWKIRLAARLPGASLPIQAMVLVAIERAEADLKGK